VEHAEVEDEDGEDSEQETQPHPNGHAEPKAGEYFHGQLSKAVEVSMPGAAYEAKKFRKRAVASFFDYDIAMLCT
jgi:hypothetical protein